MDTGSDPPSVDPSGPAVEDDEGGEHVEAPEKVVVLEELKRLGGCVVRHGVGFGAVLLGRGHSEVGAGGHERKAGQGVTRGQTKTREPTPPDDPANEVKLIK